MGGSSRTNRLTFFIMRRLYNPKLVCIHACSTIWAIRVGYMRHSYIDLNDTSRLSNDLFDCFSTDVSDVLGVFRQLFLPKFV